MCDIKPLYVWNHMNPMWHDNHSFWHQKSVFMTSYPYYSWIQTQCIWHDIHYNCDITATVTMTRQLLWFYMIHNVFDISHSERMTTQRMYLTWYPMFLCNQTHCIDDITTYVHMKSNPLHVCHHRHFIWHHIRSWWQHTFFCMSWHTLCLWHHIYYI